MTVPLAASIPQLPEIAAPVSLVGVSGHVRSEPVPDGAVLSITRCVVSLVLVLPDGSVTVTVSSETETSVAHVPTIPVQLTMLVASAGVGVQLILGIVSTAPLSTPVQVVVTLVPLFAGFGRVLHTGAVGGMTSMMTGQNGHTTVGQLLAASVQANESV